MPYRNLRLTLGMDFTNSIITPEELPTISDVSFHPLEKDYLLVERVSLLIFQMILLIIAVSVFYFVEEIQRLNIIIPSIMLFLLFVVMTHISKTLSFKYSGYALRERDLLFRSGWLRRRLRIVVKSRVQHVSIQSGPIERRFGLSSVSIFTAGSSEADFTIKGIKEQRAQEMKEWISKDINGTHNP